MKFYSEVTQKLYNSERDLAVAEAEVKAAEMKKAQAEKEKKEARAVKAKEVEKALKEANDAQAKALKLLKDFIKEYGYFHFSYTNDDVNNHMTAVDDYFGPLVDEFINQFKQ